MNVPLVANGLVPHFRSVSPPPPRQNFSNPKVPAHRTVAPSQENTPKAQLSTNFSMNFSKSATQSDPDPFKVYVRIRPLNPRESAVSNPKRGPNIVKKQDDMIFLFDPETMADNSRKEKAYVFDNVFDENSLTTNIYQEILPPAINNMVQGYNSTVLAYGMTGAGKTFTMFGDIYNAEGGINLNPGFVNLIVRDIFHVFSLEAQKGFEFNMKLSYIEIYNEQIRDLLTPTTENLMVIEDPGRGVFIPNLSEFTINNEDELLKLILQGNSRRVMASTHANQFSSRSHAIIQLLVEKRNRARDILETYTQSKLCFVDLAGSERAATTENRGIRMMEGANINRSLLALGNCINILSDINKKGAFVPYRDSKLTRLLKDSLGGNTRTIMIACISPAVIAYEETVNTLNYASRARKIKKKVVSNVKEVELHVSQYKEIIGTLKAEIDLLKSQLQERNEGKVIVNRGNESSTQEASKDVEETIDKIGKLLFTNLEENWEIRQNLKDLRDLKTQNEANLALKKEEQERALPDMTLYETLGKEIASLQEVMAYNEVVESEMQGILEQNLKEKKNIEERILAASSQWAGSTAMTYGGLEKSLQDMTQDRNSFWNDRTGMQKEFLDLHKEKVEKDSKIQQLQKEIDNMRRQLEEKDKLIARRDHLMKVKSNPQITIKQAKSPSYALRGSNGANRDYPVYAVNASGTRDVKSKRIENMSYIQNINREEEKLEKDSELNTDRDSKRGTYKGLDPVLQGYSEQSSQQSSTTKKKSKPFKGSGLNETGANTAANAIRQMVNNKYSQAFQPVSVQELKSYAEKLKGINFDSVPGKSKRQGSFKQQNTQTPSHHSHTPVQIYGNMQRASQEAYKNQRTAAKRNTQHGYPYQQRSVAEEIGGISTNEMGKNSRNVTPEKGFSEISSIVLQQNEQSLDHSVDDMLDDVSVKNNKNGGTVKAKSKKDITSTGKQEPPKTGSPNFHLNIMNLMKEEAANARQPNTQDVKIPCFGKVQAVDGDEFEGENNVKLRSVASLADKDMTPSASGAQGMTIYRGLSEPEFFKRMAKQTFSDLNMKASNSCAQPVQKDSGMVHKGHGGNRQVKVADVKIRDMQKHVGSENFDNEISITPIGRLSHNVKHNRSTSLHPNDISSAQRSLGSLEESQFYQKTQESEARRSVNEIRSLEAARDMVRAFRIKLMNLSNIVDSNMLDEKQAQEILNVIREYNEHKDLLSIKDYTMVTGLESAALSYLQKSNKPRNGETPGLEGERSAKANVKTFIDMVSPTRDVGSKPPDSYRVYKRSTDFTTCTDSLSSGRKSVPEERPSLSNLSLGLGSIEAALLSTKQLSQGTGVYAGRKGATGSNSTSNMINIYNQFSGQEPKSIQQIKKEAGLSPSGQFEEYQTFRKSIESSERSSFKGKANPEVQNLIDKQKKNYEELDKVKRDPGMGLLKVFSDIIMSIIG